MSEPMSSSQPAPLAPGRDGSAAADRAAAALDRDGYAVLPGLLSGPQLTGLEEELAALQQRVASGDLSRDWSGEEFTARGTRAGFVHYVRRVTELSPAAAAVVDHPVLLAVVRRVLGPHAWFSADDGVGAVYQDARPALSAGPSGYSRIGWHTDQQSLPEAPVWPGIAFTVHLDPTSPANGFLRVLPRSHRAAGLDFAPAFQKVPGEIAVYCERGDVLLHHSGLWHGAARGTENPPGGVRRHMRGSYLGGRRVGPSELGRASRTAAR